MQNDTVLFAPKIGVTEAASSDVQPMTRARFDVEAYIWRTAGTASAGSPLVSTPLQPSVWPRTPPALLMALVAASHETRYVGPRAASVPVNGATSATVSWEPAAAAVEPADVAATIAIAARDPTPASNQARRPRRIVVRIRAAAPDA